MGNITGHTLNPESLGFCSRVATIHAGWDFGESLCISEYVDFPHMGIRYQLTARGDFLFRLFQVQLQRQAYNLAVCHQAFLSLIGIYIYIIQVVEITHKLQVQTALSLCFHYSR